MLHWEHELQGFGRSDLRLTCSWKIHDGYLYIDRKTALLCIVLINNNVKLHTTSILPSIFIDKIHYSMIDVNINSEMISLLFSISHDGSSDHWRKFFYIFNIWMFLNVWNDFLITEEKIQERRNLKHTQ